MLLFGTFSPISKKFLYRPYDFFRGFRNRFLTKHHRVNKNCAYKEYFPIFGEKFELTAKKKSGIMILKTTDATAGCRKFQGALG